jgi:hypothetical protein
VTGVPPDLIVCFGDLLAFYGERGDQACIPLTTTRAPMKRIMTGAGIFIMNDVGCGLGRVEPDLKEGLRLYDVGSTVPQPFGFPPDPKAVGRSLASYPMSMAARVKQWWRG